ncbi:glycosyl transferase [Rhizocola hellebori]|uniref:Glycosyl transferase n=1 Tax=Rhizocola hellebori TaxID=1392758 RepID=A0A8J3VFX8_9ACTN|nr:glycosyltransferase family 4 protein [Rhizocola hellebori]GIH04542.1 glycosyl transferase [Rhizocola hellebori]
MKVVFVSHSSGLLGAERSLLALVREAAGVRGHSVTVLTPDHGPLCDRLTAAGAEVVVLATRLWMGRRHNAVVGGLRTFQAATSVPRYWRYLRRHRPDLVVTNSAVVPAGALAARLAGVRHVWVVRESLLSNPDLRSAMPRRMVARAISALADRVVAISEYVAAQLIAAAPGLHGRIAIIAPSVTSAGPMAAPPGSALKRLVLLGRASAEKGQRDAIEAVAICAQEGLPLELTLVGVGEAKAARDLARYAESRGVGELVRFVGWADDPQPFYHWADATLMLSRNEAFGRVTVESLLSGKPVIGYRAGGTSEILAGGGGALVEPHATALAGQLRRLAGNPGIFESLQTQAVSRGRELAADTSAAARFTTLLEDLHRAAP